MARYDAVIFDLFGTLIDNVSMDSYAPALVEMARAVAIEPETFSRTWRDESLSRQRSTGQLKSPEEMVHACCDRIDRKPSARAVHAAAEIRRKMYADWVVPRPGVIETLERIGQAGLKIGLMSGCTAEVPRLWESTEMHRCVDVALFSCDLGLSKPDPAFYAEAIRRLGVSPDRCLYVGDGADNELTGAVEAGMDAVLFCAPHERSVVMARAQGRNWMGKTVTDIRQVPALLGIDEPSAPADAFDVDDQAFEQTLSDSVEHWLARDAGPQGAGQDKQDEPIIELAEFNPDESPHCASAEKGPDPASTEARPSAPSGPDPTAPPPAEPVAAEPDPAPSRQAEPDEAAEPEAPAPTRRTPRRRKRRGQSPYRSVCFGLFGTLVARPDPRALHRVLQRAAERLGANPADFQRLWLEPAVQRDRHVGALASPSAAIRHVCGQVGLQPGPDALRHAVTCLFEYAWLELLPAEGVLPVLRRMKSLGWKLGCCSACAVETAHYWPRTAFASLLDAAVFSCSHRVEATEPELYRQAAAELGTDPGRCCYISRQREELQAAARAGMGAALYAPDGKQGEWDGPVLADLARVMRVLQ